MAVLSSSPPCKPRFILLALVCVGMMAYVFCGSQTSWPTSPPSPDRIGLPDLQDEPDIGGLVPDTPLTYTPSSYDWAGRPARYPVANDALVSVPAGDSWPPQKIRRVQHDFAGDAAHAAWLTRQGAVRDGRREAVRAAFQRCWKTYRQHAWGSDELHPLTHKGGDGFGGWGATLVDALDTLWIMDLRTEFDEAVRAVATIDWDTTTTPDCSLFETTIRYVGGLLAAYEMSGAVALRDKAVELGYLLLAAFDTPSHMPANQVHFARAREGRLQPSNREAVAAPASLAIEFTKLALVTGNARFYDAVDRVKRALVDAQDRTRLPGLWPTFVDLKHGSGFGVSDTSFTLGAMADSLYEYLPKMFQLLSGRDDSYRTMYIKAADAARRFLLFRPMAPGEPDILVTGNAHVLRDGTVGLQPELQHLGCFAGGMFALGGRLFDRPVDVDVGRRLTQSCVWAYEAFPTGIMPEIAQLVPCPGTENNEDAAEMSGMACAWNETEWRAAQRQPPDMRCPPGFALIGDAQYQLRPEAVESVFVLYRITGDATLQEAAWNMFLAMERSTGTADANAAIADVTTAEAPKKVDKMESFWLAETLKYLYLTFSDPDYYSLDDYVFNTEAHPLVKVA